MKKKSFILIISFFITIFLQAQVYQLPNGDFEIWDGNGADDEPTNWNGFPSSNCSLVIGCASAKATRHEKSTDVRPGTTGDYSCKIFATVVPVFNIPANGNITTGQIRIGNTTASNSANHNKTIRSDANLSQVFSAKPDSIVFWAKFKCPSAEQEARMSAIIHDDYDFMDPSGSDQNAPSHIVGQAVHNFARGNQDWVRYSIPFNYDFTATEPEYILISFTTNKVPGVGTAEDFLFIDDVEMIYNLNLDNIMVNGTNLLNFDSSITDYDFDAECLDLENISISARAESENALVTVKQATKQNPVTIIIVAAGGNTKEYKIEIFNYLVNKTYETGDICVGETYTENGFDISDRNEAGKFIFIRDIISGGVCEETVLTLNVHPKYLFEEMHELSEDETYTWHGADYDTPGTYYANYETEFGCDSIYKLVLTFDPEYLFEESYEMCKGDVYQWQGTDYRNEGKYYAYYKTQDQKDSIYSLDLTVNPLPEKVDVEKNPLDGILNEGSFGEISISESYTGTFYWTVAENEVKTTEIEGSGSSVVLGNSFTAGIYSVWSRNEHNCLLKQSQVEFTGFSDSKIISGIDLKLYPNPVKDILNFRDLSDNTSINIFDLNGKLLINTMLKDNYIDISALTSGTYVIIVKTPDGQTGMAKIIRE